MGTPRFGQIVLDAMAGNHDIVAVVTQPDRKAGRGRKVTISSVKAWALEHSSLVLQPPTLRGEGIAQQLADLAPEGVIDRELEAVKVVAPPGTTLAEKAVHLVRGTTTQGEWAATVINLTHGEGQLLEAEQLTLALAAAFPDHRMRGVKEANFAVLRLTRMPAVLVECEFITHPVQLAFLDDAASQIALSVALADGIAKIEAILV